jgi:hypothetical protein
MTVFEEGRDTNCLSRRTFTHCLMSLTRPDQINANWPRYSEFTLLLLDQVVALNLVPFQSVPLFPAVCLFVLTASGFQNLGEVFKVAPVRPMQRVFTRRLQQDHFVIYPFAVEIQLDLQPRVLGLLPLRIVELAKGNDLAFTPVVLD